jgi:MinD superfamily P-loop ATPase
VGKPPQFLFDVRRRSKWHRKARLLLEAFQEYEASLCGGCAQSAFHAFDVANTRAFETDEAICLGCNVRATHEDQYGSDKKRPKGLKVFVVSRMGAPDLVED